MADVELIKFRGNIMYQMYPKATDAAQGSIFRIVTVHPEDPGKDIKLKGNSIPDWDPEDLFEFYGSIVEDPKYGSTFVASQSIRLIPSSNLGRQRFLERNVAGVGKKIADRLVEHFDDIIAILDNQPGRLTECPGISETVASKITRSWQEDHDPLLRQVGLWLAQWGIGDVWAKKFIKAHGPRVIEKLQENPYLAMKVEGIGFRKSDDLAHRMGWPEVCPERTEAAITYVITEGVGSGHCFLNHSELIEEVRKIASSRKGTSDIEEQLPLKDAEAALARIVAMEKPRQLIQEKVLINKIPWVFYYLPHLHEAENRLAKRIGELQSFVHVSPRGIEETLKRVEQDMGQVPSAQQREAVIAALTNNLSILTGGPGSGKTATLNMLLRTTKRLGLRVEMCAPTGRAAKRMAEVTGEPAQTIHKLLQCDGETGEFNVNGDNPLTCDLLICDESSMLDITLADSLMDAVPDTCSVVFVGDTDQLPSVGPGMVLRDLIRSQRIRVTELTTIFRQAENSLIIRNAYKIRAGEMPIFPDVTKGKAIESDSYFMEVPRDAEKKDDLDWIKRKLPAVISRIIAKLQVDAIRQIQVLVPMRKGPAGFPEFNKVLQQALNPEGEEKIIKGQKFRVGDRVMHLVNNYTEGIELSNGDIGFIKSFDDINDELQIDFEGRIVNFPFKLSENLVLSYATTTHKAQGSEFDVVIATMTNHHYPMLERNLLYTLNTRAKRLIIYLASWSAMERAVKTCNVNKRNTFLAQRVRKEVSLEGNLPLVA